MIFAPVSTPVIQNQSVALRIATTVEENACFVFRWKQRQKTLHGTSLLINIWIVIFREHKYEAIC